MGHQGKRRGMWGGRGGVARSHSRKQQNLSWIVKGVGLGIMCGSPRESSGGRGCY